MSKSYEQIRAEVIEQIEIAFKELEPKGFVINLTKYKDLLIERALLDLDNETKHYIEVGKAAEQFFGSMKLGGNHD